MRIVSIIGAVMFAGSAGAQSSLTITLSELEAKRPSLAGDRVIVRDVTVFNFAQYKGGSVRDRTGTARIDDAGMTASTVNLLERHCSGFSSTPAKVECQGSLSFKVTLREADRGVVTIREAEFTPK